MTVETDLVALIKPIVARVFADFADLATDRPYAIYQQIGGEAVSFLGNEIPSKKNGRFQVTVWADTRKEAAALALAIENTMLTTTVFQATPDASAVADADPDLKRYAAQQDFSIWSNR